MAEVLAPIVQQTTPVTMLHTANDAFPPGSPTQAHHQSPRSSQVPRTHVYNVQNGAIGYRGTPIAPYAFQATPQLKAENRSTSAPVIPYAQHSLQNQAVKLGHPSHPSSSSESTISSSSSSRSIAHHSKDDTFLPTSRIPGHRQPEDPLRKSTMDSRPVSAINLSTSVPDLSLSTFDMPPKSSPDRYRRSGQRKVEANGFSSATQPSEVTSARSAAPSGSGMATVAHLYNGNTAPTSQRPSHYRASSADDTQLPRQGVSEQAKRYRRRSVGGFDGAAASNPPTSLSQAPACKQESKMPNPATQKPSHERTNSRESISSNQSNRVPSAMQETQNLRSTGTSQASSPRPESKSINVPIRGSSSDMNKRGPTPSPLSKPVSNNDIENTPPAKKTTGAASAHHSSPAIQHLASLNDKEVNKGMKSRLRRAFSFGSAAELRKASAENNMSAGRAKLQKERDPDELEGEDAAIAAKQEAAGIGASIYSGQGGFFGGSTDNLSISSTASSASVMLRKMGKGMKKGGRSLKGLFRPKSVIGVPAADGPIIQPSLAQVSMVTAEAERGKVNVNANPVEQPGGGTGFPRLERNSIDASTAAIRDGRPNSATGVATGVTTGVTTGVATGATGNTPGGLARQSIIGGEKERADVLAAVRKGILKRPGTNSPAGSPAGHSGDSPRSDSPSTPDHGRTGSLNAGEGYFAPPKFPNSSTKSLPTTPNGHSRNITFSPRIQFHDAFSASEYDRRGDIATCNRLTPMLAQQIKEELNTFKMEMEVHELSKPHTHFF